jgi:hypothetical protein
MTYTVIWPLAAIQELARLEAADADPDRVRKAGDWIDYTLRRMPGDVGESREGAFRVWYGDVLGVYFHVDQDTQVVRVITPGPARRR